MRPFLHKARTATFVTVCTLLLAGAANAAVGAGKILFISTRDGNAQIYSMNADGSDQRALTAGTAENTEPAWSPDGNLIAFTSYRDGNAEIYVMNSDGSGQRRLTDTPFTDNAPTWTRDGRIIFRSNRDRWANFYSMNSDGSGLRQLTRSETDKGVPVLSPDGKWIAFVSHEEKGSSEIHVIPMAGGKSRNLTGALSKNRKLYPTWTPDGSRLLYLEAKDPALNIRAVDPDGKNPSQITDNGFSNAFPVCSPDGTKIAFVSSRSGGRIERARGDIFVMNADGSGAVNLTNTPDEENYPAWAPDGGSIYFVSLRDGTAQIYSVPSRGGAQRRLTHDQGNDVAIVPMPLTASITAPAQVPDAPTVLSAAQR